MSLRSPPPPSLVLGFRGPEIPLNPAVEILPAIVMTRNFRDQSALPALRSGKILAIYERAE